MWVVVPFEWPSGTSPYKDPTSLSLDMSAYFDQMVVRSERIATVGRPTPKVPWLVRYRWLVLRSLLVVTVCSLLVLIIVDGIPQPSLWVAIPVILAMVLFSMGIPLTLVVLFNYILPNRKSRQQEVEPTITWEGYGNTPRGRPR